MNTGFFPPLTPITSPWMHDLLADKEALKTLFEQHGSPINVHQMEPFEANYETYQAVFNRHEVKHKVFFARKANKCRAYVQKAKELDIGVDVASYQELKQCLDLGCDSENLVLTAAIKTERLVRLALANDVLIVLDNEEECSLINRIAGELGKTPTVALRISGFRFEGEKLYSRFGFDIEKAQEFITQGLGTHNAHHNLRFGGFHFHLDGYSIRQRAEALLQTIELSETLAGQHIETSFIDIGGGLLTRYVAARDEWMTFWEELKKALQGKREPVTFGNNPLGFVTREDKVEGKPNVYPYFNETPKAKFLEHVLSYEDPQGNTVAERLREQDIELRIEPGRSLLDQVGMTMAKVAHRKKDMRGDWLVGLEMNRSQLFSSSEDFLVDPLFVSMQPSVEIQEPASVYFTGAYCLEQDIILKRKITLPQLPEIGDVIAFPNTAGYMMHFYETRSHLHPFTKNVIMNADSPTEFTMDTDI
ncbi:Y4yA family PLP-dependent enzyme [Gracilimonas mengyeensis]|uniref:Diaminopimelate decarboxylase n=1 Tax=Gracilimonas mengyeensis TaxID=1302730 RepID=A0A521CQI1_9BACT|nr:Y4yA family PLP-dependent enzyme [Gracilimonas mengyeensis]SMO61729.1 diaminopimelate decarboxylase [Gracilimonas mengyeensis]